MYKEGDVLPEGIKGAVFKYFKPFNYVKGYPEEELVSGYPSLWNKGCESQEDGFLTQYEELSERWSPPKTRG